MKTKTHAKRTVPNRKKHRAALELHSSPSKTERIVAGAKNRYAKILKAQADFDSYISKQIIEGILEKYNEGLSADQHIDTIQLFDQSGDYKLSFERQITRVLDGRAEMAKNLVEAYLVEVENKTIELDADAQLVYNLLRSMFFSRNGFKFSPQLNQFLMLDEAKIHDTRLLKAHRLLKESIKMDRSNWYAKMYVYKQDPKTSLGSYEKMTIEDVEQ